MNELVLKVEKWGVAKGLDKTSKVAQTQKVLEEFAETVKAYNKKDVLEIKDGIGDTIVTLIIVGNQNGHSLNVKPIKEYVTYSSALQSLSFITTHVENKNISEIGFQAHANYIITYVKQYADEYGWTLEECLQTAYDVIKNRKGKTTDKGFIKDED